MKNNLFNIKSKINTYLDKIKDSASLFYSNNLRNNKFLLNVALKIKPLLDLCKSKFLQFKDSLNRFNLFLNSKFKNLTIKINSNPKVQYLLEKYNKFLNNFKNTLSRIPFPKLKIKSVLLNLLLVLIILTTLLSIVSITAVLKNKQLCSYQSLVDSGLVVSKTNENLCRNILNSNEWLALTLDIFNNDFEKELKLETTTIIIEPNTCIDNDDPECWLKQLEGEIKSDNGYTNILIVGSDSRSDIHRIGNTDTIILASFNSKTGDTILTSYPRDLIVQFKDTRNQTVKQRINAIYATYEIYGNKSGVANLNRAISQISDKPIHYHVYLSFETFIDLVDKVGGVTINLETPFKNAFPSSEVPKNKCKPLASNNNYCYFEFPAGINEFDSFEAMVFARSRYLSNDYDRAKRQQQLIAAVLKSVATKDGNIIEKFNFYNQTYNDLSNGVITNISLKDVSAFFKLYNTLSGKTTNIVVDPNLAGNNRFVYDAGTTEYGYSIFFHDYSYKTLQNFIATYYDYLTYNVNNPKILVKVSENYEPKNDFEKLLLNKELPFAKINIDTIVSSNNPSQKIYIFDAGKTSVANDLKANIPNSLIFNTEIEDVKRSAFGEDILIILN